MYETPLENERLVMNRTQTMMDGAWLRSDKVLVKPLMIVWNEIKEGDHY